MNFGNWDKKIITYVTKQAVLKILTNLEKQRPERRVYINLFDTGIIIDTEKIRDKTIKALKKALK